MKDYNIVEAKRENGSIKHTLDNGEERYYKSIRAGLSLPSQESKGSFVILGEEHHSPITTTKFEGVDKDRSRGKLILFSEHETSSVFLEDLAISLFDSCILVRCDRVYADFSEEKEENLEEIKFLREMRYKRGAGFVAIEPALFPKSLALGLTWVRRWLAEGLLVFPEDSLTRKQLKAMTVESLADSEKKAPGMVDALRFCVAAFEKFGSNLSLLNFRPTRKRYARGR